MCDLDVELSMPQHVYAAMKVARVHSLRAASTHEDTDALMMRLRVGVMLCRAELVMSLSETPP